MNNNKKQVKITFNYIEGNANVFALAMVEDEQDRLAVHPIAKKNGKAFIGASFAAFNNGTKKVTLGECSLDENEIEKTLALAYAN